MHSHTQINITGIVAALMLSILAGCGGVPKTKGAAAEAYVTMPDKSMLLQKHELFSAAAADATININTDMRYQVMDGFGYTLTGGSAMHISRMSAPARKQLLEELYGNGPDAIGVSYIRVSVGASDLDEKVFSYNDLPAGQTDLALAKFDLGYDKQYLIPVLQQILKINPSIKILASPWSPPVWMKDNGDVRGGSLQPKYYGVYADYLVKYVQEMKKQGITIDAMTIQNEPLHPGNTPSLLMPADAQREFVKNSLGPAFERNGLSAKIIIYDHNADRPDYPISILDDPQAKKYIDGSAFHLYGGEVNAISKVHNAHPDKNLYFTEQWVGAPGDFAKELSWHIENLIIGAPRNWCKTVLEWNLAADENQDPHTDRGGCDRCLGAITITGDKVTREPAYYIIAHASKFVPSGSVRVGSDMPAGIPNVAYVTPSGKIATVIQNTGNTEKNVLLKAGSKSAAVKLKAGAVATILM